MTARLLAVQREREAGRVVAIAIDERECVVRHAYGPEPRCFVVNAAAGRGEPRIFWLSRVSRRRRCRGEQCEKNR